MEIFVSQTRNTTTIIFTSFTLSRSVCVAVKIEGKTIEGVKQKFRGFHIRVARVGYDYEQAVGYFKEYPETARGQDWYPQPEYPKDAPVSRTPCKIPTVFGGLTISLLHVSCSFHKFNY